LLKRNEEDANQIVCDMKREGTAAGWQKYRGADKSLARPGRKQAAATEVSDVHISYL